MRILLVEDDPETAGYLEEGLRGENHDLHVAADGRSGLLRTAGESWDLLIIDRMLPGLDGLALVRTLRASGNTTPVLFLTTMGGIDDRVTGLGLSLANAIATLHGAGLALADNQPGLRCAVDFNRLNAAQGSGQ